MAQRRMFSPDIVCSDAFLDMPISTQALYFHLAMRADDDGFVNPKMVLRLIGSSDDDLKVLKAKRFVLSFETGVIVIKHWLVHNLIRADLYKETMYIEEKETLGIKDNGSYTELKEGIAPIKKIEAPEWLKRRRGDARTANVPQTALRLGKDRLGKEESEVNDDVEQEEILQPEKKKYEMADFALAEYLLELIRTNVPTFKQPDLEKWAEHVRLMRERDGRTFEQIKYLIKWSQENNFWKANILSTSKLREKFDQLTAQVKRDRNGSRQVTGKGVA